MGRFWEISKIQSFLMSLWGAKKSIDFGPWMPEGSKRDSPKPLAILRPQGGAIIKDLSIEVLTCRPESKYIGNW